MPVLHIFKLESQPEEHAVSQLLEGEHVVGRGPLLQCEDRRVSRNHGLITITQNDATITSTHINPFFYQPASSTTITILTRNTPMHLDDGDKFAFLADKFWYRIKVEETTNRNHLNGIISSNTGNTSDVTSLKRDVEHDVQESPGCSKRQKIDTESSIGSTTVFNVKNESNNNKSDEKQTEDVLLTVLGDLKYEAAVTSNLEEVENHTEEKPLPTDLRTKTEVLSDSESDTTNDTINKNPNRKAQKASSSNDAHEAKLRDMLFSLDEDGDEMKIDSNDHNQNNAQTENNASTTEDDKAGPSNTNDNNKKRVRRDRCWYGLECYRKKQLHLAEYSHPGDSDYASDPEDDRPMCSFGAACFRRNKDHIQAYKHPKDRQKPQGKRTKKNTAPKRKRAPKQPYNDTPEDDYDFDDPFIDDSGSEYEANSTSEDTDSDSSATSEKEPNRLLKEAKRFMGRKKHDEDD